MTPFLFKSIIPNMKLHEDDVFNRLRTVFRPLFAGERAILSEFDCVKCFGPKTTKLVTNINCCRAICNTSRISGSAVELSLQVFNKLSRYHGSTSNHDCNDLGSWSTPVHPLTSTTQRKAKLKRKHRKLRHTSNKTASGSTTKKHISVSCVDPKRSSHQIFQHSM